MFLLQHRSQARALAAECESFVNGCLAEHLLLAGSTVPAWAWTNLLAHGTAEDLADPPVRLPDLPAALEPWVHARAYLAAELRDAVAAGTPLAVLQRDGLAPLELELMRPSAQALLPTDWVAEVLAALDRATVGRGEAAQR